MLLSLRCDINDIICVVTLLVVFVNESIKLVYLQSGGHKDLVFALIYISGMNNECA